MEPRNVWPFESSLSSNMMVSLSASSYVNIGAEALSGFYNNGSLSYGAPLLLSAINQCTDCTCQHEESDNIMLRDPTI